MRCWQHDSDLPSAPSSTHGGNPEALRKAGSFPGAVAGFTESFVSWKRRGVTHTSLPVCGLIPEGGGPDRVSRSLGDLPLQDE